MDNLPAVTKYFTETDPDDKGDATYMPHYEKGFALGFVGGKDVCADCVSLFFCLARSVANLLVIRFREMSADVVLRSQIPNSQEGVRYLNNHIRMLVLYHEEPDQYAGNRIVGFEVEPFRLVSADVVQDK